MSSWLSELIQGVQYGYLVYLPEQFGRKRVMGTWEDGAIVLPFDDLRSEGKDVCLERQAYMELVERAIHSIKTSDLDKIVTSRKVEVKLKQPQFLDLWMSWLEKFPNAFVFCIHHPQWGVWMGASPELLAYSKGDNFETMALAGSKAIDDTSEWTPKEKSEHQMVVNMIGDVLDANGVVDIKLSPIQELRYAKVKHLQTPIGGKMKGDWFTLIKALHPTPALSGSPVGLSKAWLAQNEGYDRKLYGGVMELIVEDEKWAFVLLRCIHIQSDASFAYVGGGVMENSDPELEWKETMWKLKSFIFAPDEDFR
jgi:isochorismate synthase